VSWAVVGAGYAGVAVAAAMLERGLEVDVLDSRAEVGGLWVDATYPSVRLITSRDVTAYDGWPMPAGGLFPTGPELLAYLQDVAGRSGVLDRLRQQTVTCVRPGEQGWLVDGTGYDGLVLATGLFSAPRIPVVPGVAGVPTLHTSAYRGPEGLGERVLVVGLGNSGADVAQDCVKAGRQVTMAVGRARHVVPKRVLGQPVVRLRRPGWVPDLASRVVMDAAVRAASAYWRHGALAEPRHLLLSESPVVHSALLPLVSRGAVRVRPALTHLDGADAQFADGSCQSVDSVVWATGYAYTLPVARELLDGSPDRYGETPLSLVGGAWSPVSPGLAAVGHREPRHGRGPYLSAVARLVAAGAAAQSRTDRPVGRLLADVVPPSATALVDDVTELPRLRRLTAAAARLPG